MRIHHPFLLLLLIGVVAVLPGCRRLTPTGYLMSKQLERRFKRQIPVEIFGKVVDSKGRPIPGLQLGIQRTGINWPGFARGENHAERHFEIVVTDDDGNFEYHDQRGGTVIVSDPREFVAFVDDQWEVVDHEASRMHWHFRQGSVGTDGLPFIPTPDRRSMIHLKKPETHDEKMTARSADAYTKKRTGKDPVHHQQYLPEQWPPIFPPEGYATDG